MKRINLYEYDKRNRNAVVAAMGEAEGQILSWALFAQEEGRISFPTGTQMIFVDASSLFANEDRAGTAISYLEKIISIILQVNKYKMYLIVERQYAQTVKNLVYYRISKISSLESLLKLENCESASIVDISEPAFEKVYAHVNRHLFGNEVFKQMLKTELQKFRVFNLAGYQSIFSMLLCGSTGIGKTELARLLHRGLAGKEPIIKINFGNYSSENSLNSLIGSPRGYIGSNKGELSEKLSNSRSTVILIDEFEKASKPVYNFFLQLLEDGKFTDSMGRDYDLNQYIIIFTSNIEFDKIAEILSPELRSRFSLIYHMQDLSDKDKRAYVDYKIDRLLHTTFQEKKIIIPEAMLAQIKDINVAQYQDLRKLNAEMMHRLAEIIYPLLYPNQ